jgi:hypothetical protein
LIGYFEPWQQAFPPQIIQGLLKRQQRSHSKQIRRQSLKCRIWQTESSGLLKFLLGQGQICVVGALHILTNDVLV